MGGESRELLPAPKSGTDQVEVEDEKSTESPLATEYVSAMAPPAATEKADEKTTEQKADGSDRVAAANPPAEQQVLDPYQRMANAQKASEQLDLLKEQKRGPDEKIVVREGGKVEEMTVSDRYKQLKETIVREIGEVKKLVDDPGVQKRISEVSDDNTKTRNRLAKELGMDPLKVTLEGLKDEYNKPGQEQTRRDKIVELAQNLQDRTEIERLRRAPEYVRLLEAEYTSKGYANPKIGPGDEIPRSEFNTAFQLLSEAGRLGGADLKGSKAFQMAESSITMQYATNQQERSINILKDLGSANEAGKKGDKKAQEESLKHAVELADKVNTGFIADQALLPRNLESGVSAELIDIVTVSSNARLEYAQFLVGEGRFHEAQGLLNQVKVDNPEILYEQDPKTGKISYRHHGDKSYETLDQVVTMGVTINPGTFDQAQSRFFQKIQDGDIGTKDGEYSGAYKELATMMRARDQIKQDVEKANLVLEGEKKGLQDQQKTFLDTEKRKELTFAQGNPEGVISRTEANGKTSLTVDAKGVDLKSAYIEVDGKMRQVGSVELDEGTGRATITFDGKFDVNKDKIVLSSKSREDLIERGRVEREIGVIDSIVDQRTKSVARIDALTDFSRGWLALARQDFRAANGHFKSSLAADPGLDADLKAMQERNPEIKTIKELSELSENDLSGWWQRNYKKVAVAGAMAAGLLSGVGVIGIASSLEAGIVTTAVAATAVGGLTGGGVHWGIHRTVNPNAGWVEFRDGAKIGAMSAGMVASPWAARALQAEALAAGTATTIASTSRIANLARTLGITRGTLAGGLAIEGTLQAGDLAFTDKSVYQAGKETLIHGSFDALFLGMARKWGLAKNVADGTTVARLTTAQNFGNVGRTFMFMEGFDTAINLGLYGYSNRIMQRPYYLTDGPGFILPILADHYKHNYGSGLDLSHPGDKTLFDGNSQQLGPTLGGSIGVERPIVDPTSIGGEGLFFDYSKKRPPIKKGK